MKQEVKRYNYERCARRNTGLLLLSDRSSASPLSSHTSIHNANEDIIPLLSVPVFHCLRLTSTMRLLLAYCSGSFIGLFGAGCSAETQLVMKDRSYYAWGYEGDTTEGVPNG